MTTLNLEASEPVGSRQLYFFCRRLFRRQPQLWPVSDGFTERAGAVVLKGKPCQHYPTDCTS
jgi:hypothetical protein